MAQAVNKWLLTFLINKEKEALYFILQPPVAEEDDFSSSSCNILLYFGLGLMCVGSVIAFVGEDQTLLLREMEAGPSQIKVSIEEQFRNLVDALEN